MASLISYDGGLRRIEFTMTPNGPRRVIRLGRKSMKNAKGTLARVEAIIADKLTNRPHDAELSQWIAGVDETLLVRLRAAGLADGVGVTQTTLGEFLDRVFDTLNVKPSTRQFYEHTKRNLLDYFTAGRRLGDITEADADAWRSWLVEHEGLGSATVARRVVAARTIWRKAIRWKLVAGNPFEGIRGGSQQNESRKQFITREMIQRVIDSAPDAEWRLMIGLARFGGLRCPSETLLLRWEDVDWERGTLQVHSPKTEHHEGHAVRVVPMFPELRPLLLDAFEAAPEGAEYAITRYRDATQNVGTHFRRIIKRAGVKPWPRLWQNLRASRESELMRDYDLSTACAWIGNSPAVAARHYAMSVDRDADFRKAIGLDEAQQKAQQKAQQSASASDRQGEPVNPADGAKPLENRTVDNACQSVVSPDNTREWAILDLNQ